MSKTIDEQIEEAKAEMEGWKDKNPYLFKLAHKKLKLLLSQKKKSRVVSKKPSGKAKK